METSSERQFETLRKFLKVCLPPLFIWDDIKGKIKANMVTLI